jgi:amino acid transporter
LPWWLYSLLLVAAVGVLGYFRIDLSARVLTVVMIIEIVIVLIFDIAVGVDGGPEGLSTEPFLPSSLTSGSIGVAVLFAVITFLGFEATAIFREETKEPRKTVPRATYLAVAFVGVFYVITTWLLVVAYGPTQVEGAAAANAPGLFGDSMGQYVGVWASDVLSVLVVTSAFAAVLSCQNIIARYGFALGSDGALPAVLGRVHPRHGSPFVSSLVFSGIFLLGVLGFSGSDPALTYAWLAGAGGFPLLLLMFLTSVAVVVFFRRSREHIGDSTAWHTLIAPVLAMVALAAALYLALTNFVLLTGGDRGTAIALQIAIWGVFLLGIVLALYFRAERPEVYARIGRQKIG